MERDPSFVFNGAYTPAVCRIVSAVVAAANSPNPDAASAELKNLVPGHKGGMRQNLLLYLQPYYHCKHVWQCTQ